MSARDDYPVVAQWLEVIVDGDPDLYPDPINREMRAALDEIDLLRALRIPGVTGTSNTTVTLASAIADALLAAMPDEPTEPA